MTEAKQTLAAKLSVAFVAVAMVFTMFAPAAQAQTPEEMQQLINDLLAQVSALQAQLGQDGQSTGAGASDVCPYTWTRDLSMGSSGNDVLLLQQFLNADPDTRVAASGIGSAGQETDYYGSLTAAAVSKFQTKYRADVLTPLNIQSPTGYFGSGSRDKANDLCVTPAPTPAPEDGDDEDGAEDGTEDEDETEDEEDEVVLGGTARLDTFEVDDASDTDIEEGDTDVEIGSFVVEFENGDAEIAYMDIALLGNSQSNTNSVRPWDAFENVSLWMDGDKIAEVDADREDDYLDEDDGTLRFGNLGLIAEEDEEFEIVVGASIQNNLDSEELVLWDLTAEEMRYFDADGVATNETNQDELGDGTAATFEIEEAGEGEELNFSLSSSNPDATDIVVDESSRTNDVTIMEYEIEAEDGDIELDTLFVNVLTGTANYEDVVSDIELRIDGQTFRDEAVTGATSDDATVEFDIDGDIVIDEDDTVTVEVIVDLKAQNGTPGYNNGETIQAQVTVTERDQTVAEGADDLSSVAPNDDFSGSAIGDEHVLVAEGIVVPVDSVSTNVITQGDNDTTGVFTIDFEVTAVEGDFYITEDVFEDGSTATTGVKFSVESPNGTTTSASGVLASNADEDTSGVFTVREGQTEDFTMTVTVDAVDTGQHRVSLTEVNYTDQVDGVSGAGETYATTPAQDYRTSYVNINAN